MTWPNDVEQMSYFGLRIVYGHERSREDLRALARRSVASKLRFAAEWQTGAPLPPIRVAGEEHLDALVRSRSGAMIALPHVGPYQRVPLFLAERGIATTLLLDGENFEQEQARARAWRERFTGTQAVPLEYLNVHDVTAAWRAVRAIRSGSVAVAYVDGNTGVDSAAGAASAVVRFHGVALRVRKGIGILAGHAGAPVVPLLIERRDDHDLLSIGEPLVRGEGEALGDYAHRVMQQCYEDLARLTDRDPAVWEEWYHLNLWHVPPGEAADGSLAATARLLPDLDNIDLLELSCGTTIAHIRTGAALLATPAVLQCLARAEPRTLEELEASARNGGGDMEEPVVSALVTAGFLRSLDAGAERR